MVPQGIGLPRASGWTLRGYVGTRVAGVIHRQERQAKIANSGDHPMECRLVGDWPTQNGGPIAPSLDRQIAEPFGPAVVEMTANMKLIVSRHCLSFVREDVFAVRSI